MNRNNALDMFRGLLLVIMTLDHLPGQFRTYSFESLGFASAAEGFVLLSGFVAAMVYGREGDPLRRRRWIRQRIATLYRYHLTLLFGILLLNFAVPAFGGAWTAWLTPYGQFPNESLLLAFPLLYQPRFLDILPLYCLFMAALPWALTRLRAGQGHLLLLASFSLWLLGQFFTGAEASLRSLLGFPFELGYFNLLCWQFLFFLGAYFGYRHREGIALPLPAPALIATALVCTFLFSVRHQLPGFTGIPVAALTERSSLAIVRLIDVLGLAYLFCGLFRLLPRLGEFPPLVQLGRHSLQVYSYHVLLVYLLTPSFRPLVAEYGWQAELPLYILALASLSLPVFLDRRLSHWHRHWQDAKLLRQQT
ncbi:MAG: OpgC domain-containing protein [Gammaproteobacteria bacterium]|nr:OpgC domain-containing protein [Gammaproteobacteria bacterium]